MRLITTYLMMVLVGVALGRNIETNEVGKNDEAPLLSGVETLENKPMYYRNQMRQKFLDSKKASNTAEYLKPIEIAPKKENVIPTADANIQEMVKQPALDAQLIQKVDTVKIKEPEIKENERDKEPSKISQPQTANDKIKDIPNLKETIMATNSEANVKNADEPKQVEVIREAKDIPAIYSPLKQSNANEKANLKTEPQGYQEAHLKENVKDESVKLLAALEKPKSKDKVKNEAKSELSKTNEVKNIAEIHLDKKNSDNVQGKETKNNPKSSEEKGTQKVNEVDLEKNHAKIPKQIANLTKEKDSHKNKDKNYEKKRKEKDDDDDDESDDDDSSDEEGD